MFSGKKWVGVDGAVCAEASGACAFGATRLGEVRPDGARVALALPMDAVFFEKIELPNMTWKVAKGLVVGKFDLKIPVPIEKCLVYTIPVSSSREPLFLAFGVTREAFKARLGAFATATGCNPEAVFPAAAALADGCVRHLGGGVPSALLLHAAEDGWTLVAVADGVLSGVVTLAAGDTASAVRNVKILATRFASPPVRLLVSGSEAENGLAEKLNEPANALPCPAETVPDPASFLAAALAHLGASRETDGGFRRGDFAHPACHRRVFRSFLQMGLVPLALSLWACVLAASVHVRSITPLWEWNARLDQAADRIANGPLPQRGRAAAERAKGLFDWRNPAIASMAAASPLESLPAIFEAAASRGVTFSEIAYEGDRLRLSGRCAVEADLDILRNATDKAGFAFSAETSPHADGVDFSATVTRQKGGEQ